MKHLRISLVVGLFVCAVQAASAALVPAGVGCASSAEAAVARMLGSLQVAEKQDGFRVVAVRTDALRKRSWAIVASCADAARPMVAIELEGDVAASEQVQLPVVLQVRIGDRVRVVHDGSDSRMELAGLAEDNGGGNDLVRVRMPKFSTEAAEAPPVIRCRVVGSDIVEVIR